MTDEFGEEQFEEKPFLEHLEDLRMTLLKIIVTTIAGGLVCLAVSRQIFLALEAPIRRYARITSGEGLAAATGQAHPAAEAAHSPKPESRSPDVVGPRTVVVGPVGGLLMLARDIVIYSREALSLLSAHPDKTSSAHAGGPQKKPFKPSRSVGQNRNKSRGSSGEKRRPPPSVTIIETGPTKGFIVVIKTSLICGLGATLPLSLFFLAQFVFPALTRKEKKYVTPSFLIGGVLFVVGLLFGYFITLPLALRIFVQLNRKYGIENVWKLSEYLGTVTKLLIANGVVFEMPLVLTLLVRIGVLSVSTLKKKRRHAIVIILFVAAMLSPPDAATMFMVAGPMVVMYEVCIWVSRLLMKKKRRREKEEEERESYWEERKRIKSAEKVGPEEEQKEETPPDEPPEEGDSGSPPEDYGEDYRYEDQSGLEEPPEEGEPGQGGLESDYPPPDDQHNPNPDEENPEGGDD